MAKFLTTTGISHQLEEIIKGADEHLLLISPFLKVNPRLRELLEDKNRMKIDVRVIYGKKELQPEENSWLESMTSIKTSFCRTLHAKCYLNEKRALLTSMNLYEYSQVNNYEMGILVSREEDPELYDGIYEDARRILRASDEVRTAPSQAADAGTRPQSPAPKPPAAKAPTARTQTARPPGQRTPPASGCERAGGGFLHPVQGLNTGQSDPAILQPLLRELEKVREQGVLGEALPHLRKRPHGDFAQTRLPGLLQKIQGLSGVRRQLTAPTSPFPQDAGRQETLPRRPRLQQRPVHAEMLLSEQQSSSHTCSATRILRRRRGSGRNTPAGAIKGPGPSFPKQTIPGARSGGERPVLTCGADQEPAGPHGPGGGRVRA